MTPDEWICVCISRQVQDGDVLAQGINTPLVMAGYILAKCTHAPNVTFASAIAPGLASEWGPLGIGTIEATWLEKSLMRMGFAESVAELLPRYHPKEFFRPGQIQADGRFNNVKMRGFRLPGVGGIPDVTVDADAVHLYVPRHSRAVFVREVEVVSGLNASYLVSDLGQFDWKQDRMRLTHLHPGVTVARVQQKTGFDLDIAPDLVETPTPNPDDLRLLREEIDPLGVRKLETLAGAPRKALLRNILRAEGLL